MKNQNVKDVESVFFDDPDVKKYIELVSKSTSAKPEPDFWEIEEPETVKKSNQFVEVVLSTKASAKIDTLMRKFNHMEWLAYLIGDDLYVEDIVIPKQEVTVVNVFVDKKGVDVPIIGVIHSHHDMGNDFSHTDDEYINANHGISLCVSKNGYNGQVKIDGTLFNANVVQYDNTFNIDSFIKEIDDNIKVKSHNYTQKTSGSNNVIYDYADEFDTVDNSFMETKNIIGVVNEYMIELKDLSLINNINIDEIIYIVKLINAIGTDEFDSVESEFYDADVDDVSFSDTAISLIDEIDIFNDTLTNTDIVKLNELYNYLIELNDNYK